MKVKQLLNAGFFALAFAAAGTANANLLNGDFSGGFDNWIGETTDINFVTVIEPNPPGSFPNNFNASSGAAVLTTSTASDEVFSVFLFQQFVAPTIAVGETLLLNLDLVGNLSDEGAGDLIFAQLNFGPGLMSVFDLTAGSEFDVSFVAGSMAELLFGVEDIDDIADTLQIDNIDFTVVPAAVPLLPSALLMLCGLPFLRKRRLRHICPGKRV